MNDKYEQLKRLKIFISSPSDLLKERDQLVDIINGVNQLHRISKYFILQPCCYENNVPAAVGRTPQKTVDHYMLKSRDADIFICIIWQRIGTPFYDSDKDQHYRSGTEYEFIDAYNSFRQNGLPIILLYRCMRPISPNADIDQVKQVQNFFNTFHGEHAKFNGLYREYTTIEEFNSILFTDINTVIENSFFKEYSYKLDDKSQSNSSNEKCVNVKSSSDILITSVYNKHRLLPLSGYPIISATNFQKPIFTGGCRISITLSHNMKGPHSITVNAMQLKLINFFPGTDKNYSYTIEGDEIIGAGLIKPNIFSLSIFGNKIGHAKWSMQDGTIAVSKSQNFFDIESPQHLFLNANSDDCENIICNVICQETGLYELAIEFFYSVAGNDRNKKTDNIFIYYE